MGIPLFIRKLIPGVFEIQLNAFSDIAMAYVGNL